MDDPTLSQELKDAVATVVAAEEKLPPEYQATFHQALLDIARLVEQEADTMITAKAAQIPLFGKMIGNAVVAAVNKDLEAGVSYLVPAPQGDTQ